MLSGATVKSVPSGIISPPVDIAVTSSTVSPWNRLGAASWTPKRMAEESAIQMASCVKPTSAMPTILPINSCMGRTEEISTSTMRFDFSSSTPRSTWLANIMIMK